MLPILIQCIAQKTVFRNHINLSWSLQKAPFLSKNGAPIFRKREGVIRPLLFCSILLESCGCMQCSTLLFPPLESESSIKNIQPCICKKTFPASNDFTLFVRTELLFFIYEMKLFDNGNFSGFIKYWHCWLESDPALLYWENFRCLALDLFLSTVIF